MFVNKFQLGIFCTIGPMFCAVKKEVRRKRNTQTRRSGKKYSSRFYSFMIAVIQLVHFCCILPLPSPWWWRCVCESWLFDTRLSQQIGCNRQGYDGSVSRTFNALVLTTAFNSLTFFRFPPNPPHTSGA